MLRVPRIFTAIAAVFAPIPDILPAVVHILPAVAAVFAAILDIFSPVMPIFQPIATPRNPVRMLGLKPFEGFRTVLLELLQLLCSPRFPAAHQLGVALGMAFLQTLQALALAELDGLDLQRTARRAAKGR
jgi:hypothetical protein